VLQLINQSVFAPTVNVLPDREGIDTLFVVVRGTFSLTAPSTPAAVQPLPIAADIYWGAPGASSLKYASDTHIGKRGTDVALVGQAHVSRGRAVSEMLAAVTVARRRKVIRILGDRTWRGAGGSISPPKPFVSMPLVYERAFGGRDHHSVGDAPDGGGLAEERNPVGQGFRGRRSSREVVGTPLPNLEDPLRPLKTFGDQPAPASFGFVAPAWQPRRSYAGTYDDAWKKGRAPFLPPDFDLRFDNAAGADLTFDTFLRGGEPLLLEGVSPSGPLLLSIPTTRPRVTVSVAGSREMPPALLETVLIEPDDGQLSLTWRAALRCDKRALKIQSVRIETETAS
jgi:hypothetical protein